MPNCSAISAGAIAGSAIINLLEQYGKDAPQPVSAYVKSMKEAVAQAE